MRPTNTAVCDRNRGSRCERVASALGASLSAGPAWTTVPSEDARGEERE